MYDFTYDLSGNLTTIADNNSQIDYSYTVDNQVQAVTSRGRGNTSDLPTVTLSYNYDVYGNKTELIDPTGTTTYNYDNTNKLIGLINQKGESFHFNFDLNNKLTSMTRPGSTTSITYDPAEYLKSITHTTNTGALSFYDYQRDPVGNKIVKRSPAGDSTYQYDSSNQLIGATSPDAIAPFNQEAFSYDELGNRTDNGFQYDLKKTHLIEDFKFIYTYDVYGNLTSKIEKPMSNGNIVNYIYNSENMLTGVDTFKNNIQVQKVDYHYDALGRRVKKQVIDNVQVANNKVRKYVYEGLEVLLEYDDNNALLAKYTNSTRGIDDILSVDVTAQGRALGIAPTNGSYFFLKDAIGTVTDITNASGSIVQKYSYSAFGKILKIKDGNNLDITSIPAMQVMHTFTGREFDQEIGMYFYRARYYDPELGRFIQSDPHPGKLSNPLTYINKYIYVLNNPINSIDPLGLFSLKRIFKGAVNTVKKVMSNKVAGLIISTVVAGQIGTLAYINMSGQFHPNDVALVNTIAIVAAAVVTGGAAGSAIGFAAGGGVSGMVAGDGRASPTTDASINRIVNYHDFIRFLPKNQESIYSICLPLYQQGISLREIERQTGFAKTTILDTFTKSGLPHRKNKSAKKIRIKRQFVVKGGPAPYGYAYLEGKLVIDPKEYKTVLEIYRQWQKRKNYRAIARYLNEQAITTRAGKKWTNEIIKRIINRHERNIKN